MSSAPAVALVVTGFGPFGDVRDNPSWPVARSVGDEARRSGLRVEALLWETSFERARDGPGELVARWGRSLLVHFGVAVGRSRVSIERRAQNLRGGSHTATRSCAPLDRDGPAERRTSLDVDALVRLLEGWEASDDAGDFVCNATYYASLAATAGRSLFVHVPLDVDVDATSRRFVAAWLALFPPR